MNYKNQERIYPQAYGPELTHIKDDKKNLFQIALNWEPRIDIMCDLSAEAYRLWEYFNSWRGRGYYDFSPADIEDKFGITRNTIKKYQKEMIDKGYLVSTGNKTYNFIPYPEQTKYRAAFARERNNKRRLEKENKSVPPSKIE